MVRNRFLSLFLVLLLLFLTACNATKPTSDPSADSNGFSSDAEGNSNSDKDELSSGDSSEEVLIANASSDARVSDSRTEARCAVDRLRDEVLLGRWFSADVTDGGCDSRLEDGKRNLNLILQETSDITSVTVRWYQGGSDAEDIRDEKDRKYLFCIEASADGENWECIYPEDYEETGKFAESSTGSEAEVYPCQAKDVNYVRIVGAGCIDPENSSNNKYFAIRSVSLEGEMKGYGGGDVTMLAKALNLNPYNQYLRGILKTKRKVTVYFVRHGKSDYTISTNATASLNERGYKQAEKIADYFENREIALDAIYTSPYRRCVETAEPLADAYGLSYQIIEDFYERTISSVGDKIPDGFAQAQWADYELKLDGGESLKEVEERTAWALRQLFDEANEKEQDTVVVSTHAMALSVLLNCYHDAQFIASQGEGYYNRILSMDTPCVKCVFEGNRLTYMEFIDIGAMK